MRLSDASVVILIVFGLLTYTRLAFADGSVGCLFTKSLCKPKVEWCFDDLAFGRCLSRYESDDELDFYQYDLKGKSLQLLKLELERLMSMGYRWSHFYTQCVLKALLFALRYEDDYNESSCRYFEVDDNAAMTLFDGNLERMDPKNVGQVEFTPSVVNPHTEYADEIYFPDAGIHRLPNEPEDEEERKANDYINNIWNILMSNEINEDKRSKNEYPVELVGTGEFASEIEPKYLSYLKEGADEETEDIPPRIEYLNPFRANYEFIEKLNTPEQFRSGLEPGDPADLSIIEDLIAQNRDILKSFSRDYNTPGKFREGQETRDEVVYPKAYEMKYFSQPRGYFYPEERQYTYDAYNEEEEADDSDKNDEGVYTEGGLVYLEDEEEDPVERESLEALLKSYSSWGFKRPERLDVKKPGPSFSTNNFAFQNERETDGGEAKGAVKTEEESKPEKEKSDVKNQPEKKKAGSPMESPSLRRQTTTLAPPKEKTTMGKPEGGDYAYIELKNRVNTWQEGSRIVRKLEDLLKLSPNTFSNVKVEQNGVRFRVGPNRMNLNASEVVGRIENYKDLIQKSIGVEVMSAGVGEQNQPPSSMSLLDGDERQLWILSFLLCGVIAAVAIVGAALFVIKRHSHTREKLQNLSQMDTEASKDYQDLCRARMATKTVQEKSDGSSTTPGHRVTNLARESEGSNHSPSSRSSTSSWSEEPALTNMDISTGHMVLSYMEDHLQNKDRLEQEWIALCAYEAEPCATIIAVKDDNNKKNRYSDVLPYDHARVVLNELSNISGSDYINASTITDHDPRNPAYIATQGPLAHTAADFWQMVWEQGSVVMVMLTRLTENGTALCHRYWPEEGSQLYHIYEVHLVSEHIWCDDYLVRSFYLKNVKTGETRTVTQFHFLSWPENGIPLSTKALLEFRRKVNKSYRGRSCPIVVHCSDGVGRTGTYCLIDMVLNRMGKGAKEIDIAATLEHIRDQRPLMVRTKQQFEFVLMAVAEEVHAILKALPANPNHSPPPVVKEKE